MVASAPVRSVTALALALVVVLPAALAAAGGAPNLRVTALEVASGGSTLPGTSPPPPRDVVLVVENAGSADAPRTLVEFAVIRSDGLRDVLAGFESAPLAPGAQQEFRTRWAPPPDRFGDFDLVATVDPVDAVAESDEFDNARHARATTLLVPGLVYPARSPFTDPVPSPSTLLTPWARYGLDRFDVGNPAPGLLLDRSGNGHDAHLPEDDPTAVPGILGYARTFSGSTRAWTPFPDGERATLAFWLRTAPGAHGVLWATDAPACDRAGLSLAADGALAFHAPAAPPGCSAHEPVGARVATGTWTHVAVTTSPGATSVYVDGEPALTRATALAATGFDVTGLVVAGAGSHAGGLPAMGLDGVTLDEVLLFDRVLTPGEVALLATPPA